MPLQTRLTKLLNIRVPLVSAPMTGVAGGLLAASVCRAGGLGLLGHFEGEKLQEQLNVGREALGLQEGERLPFGLGIMAFAIEAPFGNPAVAPTLLRDAVKARPAAIWISFGAELEGHVREIRRLEQELGGARIPIFVMVGTLELGKEVAGWDVDVVIAQGKGKAPLSRTEAGGHGNTHLTGLPLFSLLPLLHAHFSTLPSPPILLAAGGLSTGAHLLSVLPFTSGMVSGTAFLASPETLWSAAHKRKLLRSKGEDTVRTMVFDRMRGTEGFGKLVDGRALRNLCVSEEEEGVGDEELKRKYAEKLKNGDEEMERLVIWAGTGVGLLNEERPAEVIVREIEQDALRGLEQLSQLLVQ